MNFKISPLNSLMTGTAVAALSALALFNPSPAVAQDTSYRHGVVPNVFSPLNIQENDLGAPAKDLRYRGGVSGVGVTTGAPKVYLVFWGSQWGKQGTANGYVTFANDPAGMAPNLQAFFKGLGTGTELWSGVMTQYCQGVASGTITCPAGNTSHVGYPTGGALAGVWEDTSSSEPLAASALQIGDEAEKAATHFGNTTTASNRNVQYFIVSPTGTNPDHYKQNGFCAWHDYTGDASLGTIPGPLLAFTNMPYVPDAGSGCGASFVNPGDKLDGVTIVGGHEYAETISDQFPGGGWLANDGEENGDLCAWVTSGVGKVQNIVLSTGKFAVQGTWSNASGACAIQHAIVH